jgi:Tfp pilus assembly protein PilF
MRSASRLQLMLAMVLAFAVPLVWAEAGGGTGRPDAPPSESAPRFDVNVEFKKGQAALIAQNFKEANRAFGRVLQVIPRDANTHLLAGMAKSGLGKPKDARRHFEKAAKFDDDLILAHQELALVHVQLGDRKEADAVLAKLRARWEQCADRCAQAEDLKAAITAIEAALHSPATSTRTGSGTEHGEGLAATPSQARRDDFLIATSAQGDRAYLEAVALINEKRFDAALLALAASQRAFGPHPDILTLIGFTHRKLGHLAIAEDYYRRALAAAPVHRGALEYYGELKVERGDLAGAKRLLAKLDRACDFGCAQAEELRRWIAHGPPSEAS